MNVTISSSFGEVSSGRASSGNLDEFFRKWSAMGEWRVGVPQWLAEATIDGTKKQACDRWGVSFAPDALGRTREGETLVIELKYGIKFEPLALAEVLHHAFELALSPQSFPGGTAGASTPIAVIISHPNAWLRSAVDALRARQVGVEALRYVEVVALDGLGRPLLWFEEYVTRDALLPCAAPALPESALAHHAARKSTWYQRTDGSGVFVASEAKLKDGCLPHDALRTAFAPLASGGYLIWRGSEMFSPSSSEYFHAPA